MSTSTPLVSVICLCYNQERFVKEAIESIFNQGYSNVEILFVDDCSTDSSVKIAKKSLQNSPFPYKEVCLETNKGNCYAFNRGFEKASGKYIIDLAADDVLLNGGIQKQVDAFEKLDSTFGVVFANAEIINEKGNYLRPYYKEKEVSSIPFGDVYKTILQKTFICPATMMTRSSVLKELGGYDETLSYEDFDFWIRSSRKYQYFFLNGFTVRKREVTNSHGKGFLAKGDKKGHLRSTLKICKNAYTLNKTPNENKALAVKVRYHMQLSFFIENFEIALSYFSLLEKLDKAVLKDLIFRFLSKKRMRFFNLYSFIKNHIAK